MRCPENTQLFHNVPQTCHPPPSNREKRFSRKECPRGKSRQEGGSFPPPTGHRAAASWREALGVTASPHPLPRRPAEHKANGALCWTPGCASCVYVFIYRSRIPRSTSEKTLVICSVTAFTERSRMTGKRDVPQNPGAFGPLMTCSSLERQSSNHFSSHGGRWWEGPADRLESRRERHCGQGQGRRDEAPGWGRLGRWLR